MCVGWIQLGQDVVLRQASVNTVIQYTDVNRLPMHSVTSSKDRHVPVACMDTAVLTVPVSGKIPATSHVTGMPDLCA